MKAVYDDQERVIEALTDVELSEGGQVAVNLGALDLADRVTFEVASNSALVIERRINWTEPSDLSQALAVPLAGTLESL
ncbi:MAG: hypothetical protein DCC48_16590 [Acidobacteria bacterium]|nr:MAG: hypothetical protein DCC48_16590 [Acidobacteriota bacterium]